MPSGGSGVLGSRFRTRMVIGALVLSFAPAIAMFMFSYGLMNRSIDKWFSSPVNALHQDSTRVANLLADSFGDNARRKALDIAEAPEIHHAFEQPPITAACCMNFVATKTRCKMALLWRS